MRFEHSQYLWLLAVIPPALILFFWRGERVRKKLLTQFVESRLLASLTVGLSPARRQIRFTLVTISVALLIVALAQLQYGYDKEEVEQKGLDIVVAVDTSKSMLATDISPNRLSRAKLATLELMQRASTDRMGLIAFAGQAFLECPLTIDNSVFQQSVQSLNVNTISEGGTAIREAIDTALTAFKEKDHYKALVLFTDGEDNDEGALEAAQNAAKQGLKIFTIGIGSAEGTLVTVTDANGNSDYIRDDKGQVVKSHLNEQLLQEISKATGGFYLPLRGADTMQLLYEHGLAQLPQSEGKGMVIRRYHEQYHWPLAIALLLLMIEVLFPERRTPGRRNTSPATPSQPAVKAKAAVTALIFTVLLTVTAAKASPAGALNDYRAGNYTNALAEYTKLAEVQTNDLRLVFNAGDAAYRATNFDLAQNLFSQVTLSPDLNLQQKAYYNLGNAQFQRAKLAKDLDGLQEGFELAEKTYQRAYGLNTNDVDSAYNWNFTRQAIEQIKQFKEAMRRAKSEADTAVRQAEFHKALEIMAPLQKTLAAKQFEDFTKKLKNIDDIANPHQP